MAIINIMLSLHTSAGIITVDRTLYIVTGVEKHTIEESLRSCMITPQKFIVLDDAITKKRCVIEPKNIMFISYNADLLDKKIEAALRKESERLVTTAQLKELVHHIEPALGQVTYEDSITGSLKVESPSKQTVISEVTPDWLIKVE